MRADPRIITALDFQTAQQAIEVASRLEPALTNLKVGSELFTAAGPALVQELQSRGFRIFLDLKFHDIPNTVAGALRSAVELGVWMTNVHAAGGRRMLEAARAAVPHDADTMLIAVTVLTSTAEDELDEVGVHADLSSQVTRLAKLAHECELDGVVCSARESTMLRQAINGKFTLVTPGIRPTESPSSDQRRVMTPAAALHAGSDYLVIGRPVTGAADPVAALESIVGSVNEALQQTGERI